ncbi:hypothetical protein BP6252_01918 [Coleophoma cylindrospora]|uniref:Zn(2)-C6 fungal-type domain-containing protein n=1 Tax=Coleophoma cylindrospora TaxID=1849047 RepID=A0A3D8SEZ6_9HELO|nr:hypothetical protein BP6252_01918 [Coleophoma cylindrospora]
MSHTPGCATCMKRRVKCDGAHPNCGQCQQTNRICFPVLQRNPKFTFVAEKLMQKSHVPTPQKKTKSAQNYAAAREMIPSALTIPLEDQAMAYYFDHYVMPPTEVIEAARGCDSYLSLMWKRSQRESAICQAILATSYNAFAKARRNHAASRTSRLMYAQAISIIQKSLLDPVGSCSDETLLAIMVLGMYELTNWHPYENEQGGLNRQHQVSRHKTQCICHMDGATAVLKTRRQHGPLNERSLGLDKLVRRQILKIKLHRGTGIPVWLKDGASFGETGFSLILDGWMVRISQIQQEMQRFTPTMNISILNSEYFTTSELKDLLEQAMIIDNEMYLWTARLTPEWSYQTYTTGCESLPASSYDGVMHAYSSLGHAVIWNIYRSIRITLNGTVITILRQLETYYEHEVQSSVEFAINTIRDLIGDICASIPFFTGEGRDSHKGGGSSSIVVEVQTERREMVKASEMAYLSAPLCTIIEHFAVSGTSYLQQQWIRSRLSDVGHATSYAILEEISRV